ncbi:MAG: hypothetical protein V1849_05605 [Chloroflexota bacterium]
MFWGKKSEKELSGPKQIPGPVQHHLITQWKMAADLVPLLKAVVRKGGDGQTGLNIRVFDESEAMAKKVQVKDYTTLNEHPDLILYEGWFDEGSKQVKLEEKKRISSETKLFTQAEIQQKIEGLTEPGSTVFFYQARGAAHGGPLGMGAAVVELNPNYPGKKQKRYIVSQADVVDLQPVGKGQRLFDSNKPKDIASWTKQSHEKRQY